MNKLILVERISNQKNDNFFKNCKKYSAFGKNPSPDCMKSYYSRPQNTDLLYDL